MSRLLPTQSTNGQLGSLLISLILLIPTPEYIAASVSVKFNFSQTGTIAVLSIVITSNVLLSPASGADMVPHLISYAVEKIQIAKLLFSISYATKQRFYNYYCQSTAVQLQHAMELLDIGKSYKQVEAMTGISKSTLIRARKREGI